MSSQRFFKLDADVLARKDLHASAKIVYAVLTDHARKKGTCWPSIRRIMTLSGMSNNTVLRALETLERAGFVTVSRLYGKSNTYSLVGTETERSLLPGNQCGTGDEMAPLCQLNAVTNRHTSGDETSPDPVTKRHTNRKTKEKNGAQSSANAPEHYVVRDARARGWGTDVDANRTWWRELVRDVEAGQVTGNAVRTATGSRAAAFRRKMDRARNAKRNDNVA